MRQRIARLIVVPALICALTSCGGGGGTGGGGSTPPPASTLSYPSASYVLTLGAYATIPAPGPGGFTNWTVSPALPAGLTLDGTTGIISGQPSAAAAAATYTVSGTGGSAALTLAVAGSSLLNLGLSGAIGGIRYVNTSVLSEDSTYTWLLQDFATGATLATGNCSCSQYLPVAYSNVIAQVEGVVNVDLENNIMIDQVASGLEVRSATTGAVQATIARPSWAAWYRLAVDGSYIAAGSKLAVTVWSPSGQMLFSNSGDYSAAQPFAAPGQLQIANGPAGANVIETIAVPTGTSTTSPTFQGTFNTWFVDGQRFLTHLGTSIWVYSNAAVQQDFAAPTTGAAGGSGDWYWGGSTIYQVGSGGTPALTVSNAGSFLSSGTVLGAFYGSQATLVDLSGAAPVATQVTNVPYVSIGGVGAFAAQSPTEWLAGTENGIVIDGSSLSGTPRTLTLGAAYGVAAGTSFISVSTAVGKIFVFNSSDDSPAGTINFAAGQLAATPDGSTLAAVASSSSGSTTINIYSLPAGTVTSTFTPPLPASVTMSASANDLGEMFSSPTAAGCLAQVISVPSGATILCSDFPIVQLSPDGTLTAATYTNGGNSSPLTNVYKNGTLVTTLPGFAPGWLSNDQLLVDDYDNNLVASGTTIYDASGNQVSTPPLVTIGPFQLVPGSSTLLYDTANNTIASLTTGSTTWASGDPLSYGGVFGGTGGVTGTQVIFISNNMVLAQPY
jgi:hypothetical protein